MKDAVKVRGIIMNRTEKAIELLQPAEDNRAEIRGWIPLSQCDHISTLPDARGNKWATMTVKGWIVDKKGFRYEI